MTAIYDTIGINYADLGSGAWQQKYGDLLSLTEGDYGYRLVTTRQAQKTTFVLFLFLIPLSTCGYAFAMVTEIKRPPPRGRGAHSNAAGRYERFARVDLDDGWTHEDPEPEQIPTQVFRDATRTAITRNQSPDVPFDRSVNPYRGCEHGCVYCFARPTHAYLGLSPGIDFETKLYVKPDAAKLLERELRAEDYVCETMALGTNTDPYQPIEKTHQVTRQVLQVLAAFRHPVGIVTKSPLVVRDIDILGPMAERGLAKVAISVTTLDRKLARQMEPRAATPERRLDALKLLAKAGIPTSVMMAPMIPALNDTEIEDVLARASDAGVTGAGYVLLRMPLEIKDLFAEWLEAHYPDRAGRVLSLMRQMRGGKDYDARWGKRMRGTGSYAQLISRRFRLAADQLGLNKVSHPLDTTQFRPPPAPGDQLGLF
jgi:DNA repair photolyase